MDDKFNSPTMQINIMGLKSSRTVCFIRFDDKIRNTAIENELHSQLPVYPYFIITKKGKQQK